MVDFFKFFRRRKDAPSNFFKFFRRDPDDSSKGPLSRPASPIDIEYLKTAGYPDEVLIFFEKGEPRVQIDAAGVRFGPISDMREENEDAFPGIVAARVGYLNIATTLYGDAYCVDVNSTGVAGQRPVFLVGHEEVDEDAGPEEVRKGAKRVCESFQEFLDRFSARSLPNGFYDSE